MTDYSYCLRRSIIETVRSFPALYYPNNPHNLILHHTGNSWTISLHVRVWGDTSDVAAEILLRDLIAKIAKATSVEPNYITIQMEKRKPCPNPQKTSGPT